MKKLLLGLLIAGTAFAYSNEEKRQLLNRNMGATANKVGLGDLVMGGTTAAVFVMKAGDTMSGNLRMTSTSSGLNHTANALAVDGSASAAGSLLTGKAGSGTGGAVFYRNDSGTARYKGGLGGSVGSQTWQLYDLVADAARISVTSAGEVSISSTGNSLTASGNILASGDYYSGQSGSGTGGKMNFRRDSDASVQWRIGLGGSAGDTAFQIRNMIGANVPIQVSTSGALSMIVGNRVDTLILSGTSTFIANTTVTASTRAALTGLGASNVAPWLIGLSTGVGYSVGATGAGSAHVILIEGP